MTACADLRLAVLGGSSPGVPVLLSALSKRRADFGDIEVRLHGRNRLRLERIARYWQLHGDANFPVLVSTQLRDVLNGATHVLCMLRPGGMEGRAQDEALALRASTPADEGIGVGGLSCFLRGRRLMKELAAQCGSVAPDALFLQMTSPLGLNVAISRQAFGKRAFGVCELPVTTAAAISRELSTNHFDPVSRGRCFGLNHQSWLYDFRDPSGADVTSNVVRTIDTQRVLGIDPSIVRDMGAIPMHYMRLYFHSDRVVESQRARVRGRGEELQDWSSRLDEAYCSGNEPDIEAISGLLASRQMNWFDDGVVPVLAASVQNAPRTLPLNLPAAESAHGVPSDAIVETDCEVSSQGIRALPASPLPSGPWQITRQLLDFERAALALPDSASQSALADVLELHPLTRGRDLRPIARELAAIRPLEPVPLC